MPPPNNRARAPRPIRVLVVDDHQLLLHALQDWLISVPLVHLVGACRSAHEALTHLPQQQPDLVLLDAHMPGMTGLDAVEPIKQWNPLAWVIIMSFDEVQLAIARRMPLVDNVIDKNHLREQFPILIQECARIDPSI